MSLTTALVNARTSLFNTSRQTSLVSQNIANANNPDYSRRSAELASTAPGARIAGIQRAASEMLSRQNLGALSAWEGQASLLAGMERLGLAVNGVDNETSPARMIGDLQAAIELYSASPSNRSLAENAIEAARQTARALNGATAALQSFRVEADGQIATAVDDLNSLLARFDSANNEVVQGTRRGDDVADALDQRDALLKQIAQFVPVSTTVRGDNDMVVTTADGTMLYETVPRVVAFDPTLVYAPGVAGNPVTIDGVRIDARSGGNAASGKLAALVQLRDTTTTTMQAQLDEIARGLVTAFAETDQTGSGLPDRAGLFTWSGAPAVPAAGTLVTGLAGSIAINAAYDATAGGDPVRLRDGGANGAAYNANPSASASFSVRLLDLTDRLDQPIAFDPAAGIGDTASLATFSANAVGWFEGIRQDASRAEENKNALFARTTAALSNATGVNIDEEMAILLELEHSYQASARLIAAVDEMLATLMAVR